MTFGMMSLHFQCSALSPERERWEESRQPEIGVLDAGDWERLQNIVRCRYEDVAEVALGAPSWHEHEDWVPG